LQPLTARELRQIATAEEHETLHCETHATACVLFPFIP